MIVSIVALTLAGIVVQGNAGGRFDDPGFGIDPQAIQIIDTGKFIYQPYTYFSGLGPEMGNILNAHYFPAMNYFKAGRYSQALPDLNYFLQRTDYIQGNPRQAQWVSTAYYARGMIYRYHAVGLGRLTLARSDFEAAVQWNERNYPAYLELARLFSDVGLKDKAASILQTLIDLTPDDEKVLEEAYRDLNTILPKPLPEADISPLR